MTMSKNKSPQSVSTHSFTLVLAGVRELSEDLETAVYEAGCDDALLGIRSGVAFLEFDREVPSLAEAVLGAIRQVEGIDGIEVVRVEPDDLVTAAEIARRTGRSRESIRLLASGLRGPGNFPPPVQALRRRSPLWPWAQVAAWMDAHERGASQARSELETATFLAVLNSALHLRRLVPAASTIQALWKALARKGKQRSAARFGWVGVVKRMARPR